MFFLYFDEEFIFVWGFIWLVFIVILSKGFILTYINKINFSNFILFIMCILNAYIVKILNTYKYLIFITFIDIFRWLTLSFLVSEVLHAFVYLDLTNYNNFLCSYFCLSKRIKGFYMGLTLTIKLIVKNFDKRKLIINSFVSRGSKHILKLIKLGVLLSS